MEARSVHNAFKSLAILLERVDCQETKNERKRSCEKISEIYC